MLLGNLTIYVFSAVLGWILTLGMIRLSQKLGVQDVPNHRSLHVVSTPRGGGLAVVFLSLSAALALSVFNSEYGSIFWSLIVGGVLIGLAGWIDDRHGLSAKQRLLVQILAALLLVGSQFGHLDRALFPEFPVSVAFNGLILILFIVWMTNLYNFMDGIDGLAGGQAFSVGLVLSLILLSHSLASPLSVLTLVLSGSALGFLFLNWSPAKIFMGDVGSAFIGFWIAGLSILGFTQFDLSPVLFLIPMSVFIVDATFTLFRRLYRRAPLAEGHREHSYQVLVRRGYKHSTVSTFVIGFNVLILGPLTAYVFDRGFYSILIPVILFTVFCVVPAFLGAGKKETV